MALSPKFKSKPPLERDIQRKARKKLEALGFRVIKLFPHVFGPGVGWPDHLIFAPSGGRATMIEYKRPGGKLTAIQALRIEELERRGFPVKVCTSHQEAVEFVKQWWKKVQASELPNGHYSASGPSAGTGY